MEQLNSIRVLHLVNGEYWSGAERVQTLLGSYASGSRVNVEYLCLKDGLFLERARELGLNVTPALMRGRFDLTVVWKVARLVRKRSVDIIHTHTVRTSLVGRLVGLVTGVPVVTHVHSPSLRETDSHLMNAVNTLVDRAIGSFSDHFIAVSQSLGDELSRSRVSQERISVIPNGIDIQAFCPARMRHEARLALGLPDDANVIGMVGLFRPRKGPEVLLDAMRSVIASVPNAWLVMLGPAVSDAYAETFRDLCRRRGIAERVVFTGFRNDVADLLAAFDVVAMPSLFGEGTPMALLEAMAMELPVVATPVEGIADVIVDGQSGFLVPVNDSDALSERLIMLLTSSDIRRRVGKAARERIEARYSAERMARETEDLYIEVLRQRHGSRWLAIAGKEQAARK